MKTNRPLMELVAEAKAEVMEEVEEDSNEEAEEDENHDITAVSASLFPVSLRAHTYTQTQSFYFSFLSTSRTAQNSQNRSADS